MDNTINKQPSLQRGEACKKATREMQQDAKKDASETASSSTRTSLWSSPSRMDSGYNNVDNSSDFEDQTESPSHNSPDAKWQRPKPHSRTKGHRPKSSYPSNQLLKLTPIKALRVSKPRVHTPYNVRELKNQVCDVQRQLSEVTKENKLLKRLQHHHLSAIQHFQNAEGSISEILTKHNTEVKVLQKLLHDTRTCRDTLSKQLQQAEKKLLTTKDSLQHLQMLGQDQHLLEREELSGKLANVTTQLEEKDRRILNLEKTIMLYQSSFNRQIATEHRKVTMARNMSCSLQQQVNHLSWEVKDRERELEKHNIYSLRYLKGSNYQGKKHKMVQTDEIVPMSTDPDSFSVEYPHESLRTDSKMSTSRVNKLVQTEGLLPLTPPKSVTHVEVQYSEKDQKQESPHNWKSDESTSEEDSQVEDRGACAENAEQRDCSDKSTDYQSEEDCNEEATELPQDSSFFFTRIGPKYKQHRRVKTRKVYTFKQTVENMHKGLPAFANMDFSSCEKANELNIEALNNGLFELSIESLLAMTSKGDGNFSSDSN